MLWLRARSPVRLELGGDGQPGRRICLGQSPQRNPCKTKTRNPDKEGQRLIDRIPIPNALPAYLIGGSQHTAICDTTAACLDQG
jgi:hypothetical protein